jgi:hypothetical protein
MSIIDIVGCTGAPPFAAGLFTVGSSITMSDAALARGGRDRRAQSACRAYFFTSLACAAADNFAER